MAAAAKVLQHLNPNRTLFHSAAANHGFPASHSATTDGIAMYGSNASEVLFIIDLVSKVVAVGFLTKYLRFCAALLQSERCH